MLHSCKSFALGGVLSLCAIPAASQSLVESAEQRTLMLDSGSGEALGTGFLFGYADGMYHMVMPGELEEGTGVCARFLAAETCFDVTGITVLEGLPLAVGAISPSQEQMARLRTGGPRTTSSLDQVGEDAAFAYIGRSALADWRRPSSPVPLEVSGETASLSGDALSDLDIAAPVVSEAEGTIGVIGGVGDGRGDIVPVTRILDQMEAQGMPAFDALRPDPERELPADVMAQTGYLMLYQDIGGRASIYYGPSGPNAFISEHETRLSVRPFSLEDYVASGGSASPRPIGQNAETVSITSEGVGLQVAASEPRPDPSMVCFEHGVAAAPGRRVVVLDFHPASPNGSNKINAWADGDTPCLSAFDRHSAAIGDILLGDAAVRGTAPDADAASSEQEQGATPPTQEPTSDPASTPAAEWALVQEAAFSGGPAAAISAGGQRFGLTCTQSGEAWLTATPLEEAGVPSGPLEVRVDGREVYRAQMDEWEGTAYAAATTGLVRALAAGARMEVRTASGVPISAGLTGSADALRQALRDCG